MKNKKILVLVAFSFSFFLSMAQVPTYLKGSEIDVYVKNESELKKLAAVVAGDEAQSLAIKYKLNANEINNVKDIVYKRELQKIVYNYLYPNQDSLRYSKKMQVEKQYKPELIKYLFINEKNVNCYNGWLIYSSRKAFVLSANQVDSIIETVININLLREDEANANYDQRGYELKAFSKILSAEQFNVYLETKLYDEVKKETDNSWKKLKENGLSIDLDSNKVVPDLFRYQMALSKANYLNYNDYGKRDKVVKTITDVAPLAARRVNSIPTEQKAKNAYKGSFVW